jgi:hypothetical protein
MQYTASTTTTNDLMEMDESSTDPNTILTIDTTTSNTIKAEQQTDETNDDSTVTEEGKEGKKPEYPMDAVLTLMQLNAGWRQ